MRPLLFVAALSLGCGQIVEPSPPADAGKDAAPECVTYEDCGEPPTCRGRWCIGGACVQEVAEDNYPCGDGGICTAGICDDKGVEPTCIAGVPCKVDGGWGHVAVDEHGACICGP